MIFDPFINSLLSMWNFSISYKKVESISPPLKLGWPCDLLWPTKCSRSEDVPILNLDPKRPWVHPLAFLDPSLLQENEAGLVCLIEESDKRYTTWGHTRLALPADLPDDWGSTSESSQDQLSSSQSSRTTQVVCRLLSEINPIVVVVVF